MIYLHDCWYLKALRSVIDRPLEVLAEVLFDREAVDERGHWSKADFIAPCDKDAKKYVREREGLILFSMTAESDRYVERLFAVKVGDSLPVVAQPADAFVCYVPPRQNYGVSLWSPVVIEDGKGQRACHLPPSCRIKLWGWNLSNS